MKITKTTRIVIAIAAAILLIIALVMLINKEPKENPTVSDSNETVSTTVLFGYDISGQWFSSHNKESEYNLELNKDGTFNSTWLDQGTYEIQGDKVVLKDFYGITKILDLIKNENNEYVLYFDNETLSFTYYRTKQEIEKEAQVQEQIDEEMIEIYNAALTQILITGEWIDVLEDTTLIFTNNDYSVTYKDIVTGELETITEKFEITDLDVKDNIYKVKWRKKDKNGNTFDITDIVVTVDGNNYTLKTGSMPFATSFKKTVDIDFTQPCEGLPNNEGAAPTESDIAAAETNNSNPTNTITSTSTRKDYVEERDPEEFEILINNTIIGTWKGTFDDFVDDNTVFSIYEFTKDKKYKYINHGSDESGTYSIKSNGDNKYHSIIVFQTNATTYEKKFYFTGNELIGMQFEGILDPTYFKE